MGCRLYPNKRYLPAKSRLIQQVHRFLFYFRIFNISSQQQKHISDLLSAKTSRIFLFPVQSRRQHFHLPKPHPVYQALQLDKRGAIHIYGGLQKRSGQTDFVYSFELIARKRCVFDCFYIIDDLRRL